LLSEGTLHCQPAFSASLGRKGSLRGKRKKKEAFRGAKGRKRKVSLRLQRKGKRYNSCIKQEKNKKYSTLIQYIH
jgi:hypothetical protein